MKQFLVVIAVISACNAATLERVLSGINVTECGIPNRSKQAMGRYMSRVYNGYDAKRGDFPWMAYLYATEEGLVDGYLCGGTLINDEFILTSSHCIIQPDSPEMYRVVLGEHQTSSRSGLETDHKVAEIIMHEDYEPHTQLNDIALIRLAKAVKFSTNIRPICLPDQGFPTDSNTEVPFRGELVTYAGKQCIVLGWSETETNWRADILQQNEATVLPRVLCSSITDYMGTYTSPVSQNDNRFCAGGVMGEDSCNVNGGGPLLCQADNGRFYLHGITSYGPEPCGQPLLPGVFTEVSQYRDWMDVNMEQGTRR